MNRNDVTELIIETKVRKRLQWTEEAVKWLQVVPFKGSLPTASASS